MAFDRNWLWVPALFFAGALLYSLYLAAMSVIDSYGARQGAALYQAHCTACHGNALDGQTGWQFGSFAAQGWRAPPLTAAGHAWMHDDKALFQHVKNGASGSPMPGFGEKLSDNQIWQVFAFVKSSWPESVRRFQMAGNPYALLPAELPGDWTYPPACEPGAAPGALTSAPQ